MPNLPLNTSYNQYPGQATDEATPPKGVASYAGLLSAMKGMPAPTSMYQRPSGGLPNFSQMPDGQVPINQPAVPPLDTSRYTPIPDWYSGFQQGRDVGGYNISNPTPGQTFIENFGSGVPGQMVVDRSNPGALIHSNRAYTPEEDFQMLGGRSSKLYQVDHIIPLWAGGADTPANKQVLTINQHELKTASQAVALTLLANGRITPTQARSMALSWDTKDNSDLPKVGDNGLFENQYDSSGHIVKSAVDLAQDVADRWKSESTENLTGFVGSIKAIKRAGGGSFWKGFFDAVPEGTADTVHALGNTGKGYLPAPVQDVVGGLLEGGASGLTGGWVSAPDESASMTKKISSLVGNIGGMLIPVGMISRGLGWSARGVKGLATLSKISAARAGFSTARAAAGEAEEAVMQVAKMGNTLDNAEQFSADAARVADAPGTRNWLSRAKDATFSWNTYKNVPGFVGYGQVGPHGLAGKLTGQEDAHPIDQFFNDLAFGVASGTIPPTIKGRATMAALPLVFGPMFDKEHPENWLVNAGVMFALHGMGTNQTMAKTGRAMFDTPVGDTFKSQGPVTTDHQAKGDKIAAFQKQYTDDTSRFVMNHVLKAYAGDSVPTVKTNEELPVFYTGNPEADQAMGKQINDWTTESLQNLFKLASGKPTGVASMYPEDIKNMDYSDWQAEAKKIVASGRHLYKQTLDPETRSTEDAKDIMSVAESIKKSPQRPPGSMDTPAATLAAKDTLSKAFLKSAPMGSDAAVEPDLPRGIFPTTGMAENVSPDYNQIIDFFSKLKTGNASRKGLLTLREDTAPFWRNLNKYMSQKDIDDKTVTPFSEKEALNALQHHGISWDQDGSTLLHNFGFASRESRIEGRQNAWNEHPAVKKWIATGGAEGLPPFKTENNNVTVGEIMRKKGWKVAVTHIMNDATPRTKISQEPFIPFRVDWEATKKLNEDMLHNPIEKKSTMSELIAQSKNGVSAAQQSAAISEIKDRVQAPADEVMHAADKEIPGDPVPKGLAKDFLRQAREVLSSDSPEEISSGLADKFGVVLDDDAAAQLFNKRSDLTVRDLFDAMTKAKETGWVDEGTSVAINDFFKPLFESKGFNKWSLSKVFPNLRILGGVKRRDAMKADEQAKMAPTEPVTADPALSPESADMPIETPAPEAVAPVNKLPVDPMVQETPLARAIVQDAAQRPMMDNSMQAPQDPSTPAAVSPTQTVRPIDIAPGAIKPAVNQAANEMYNRGKEIFHSMQPSYYMEEGQERGGAAAYARALMNVIKNLQPGPGAGKQGPAIKSAISKQLMRDAVWEIRNAFDSQTDEFGSTVPMTFEQAGALMDQAGGKFLDTPKPAPEKKGNFFEKDPFSKVSEYDILRARREKAGDELVQWIDFGKSAQPESYLHAFSYGMDKGLQTMFGGDYTTSAVKQLLGRAFGTEGRAARKMKDMYQTEATGKEMKPITQSKDYLEAMGRGDRKGMKTAEQARMTEVRQEQADSSLGDSNMRDVSPEVEELIGTGDMNIRRATQVVGKDVGMTKADTALMPGLTSILSGRNAKVGPADDDFELQQLEDTGPLAARRGIEDARNILQFILNIHNDAAGTAQKFSTPRRGEPRKLSNSYLQLTGKKQYTGKWESLDAKARQAVQDQTDTHFENLFQDYLKSVGASIGTKFSGVKNAVEKAAKQ